MKSQFLLTVLLALTTPCLVKAQYIYKIKADSVRIYNDSCYAELIVENRTKDTLGFLYNKGNGRTEFRRALIPIGGMKYLIGRDTLDLSGIADSTAWGSITGTLSNQTDLQNALNTKQSTLTSGTNIKTINGNSILGSGDLTLSGGNGLSGGTLNYAAKWTGVNSLGIGAIQDDGIRAGIGIAPASPYALYANNQIRCRYQLGVEGTAPGPSATLYARAYVGSEGSNWPATLSLYNNSGNLGFLAIAAPNAYSIANVRNWGVILGGNDPTTEGIAIMNKNYWFTIAKFFNATGNVVLNSDVDNGIHKLQVNGAAQIIGKLNLGTTTDYTDNAAAVAAGLSVGDVYRTGDLLKIVH